MKLFFVEEFADDTFWGNTVEEIFDEVAASMFEIDEDDVRVSGYLVDTETMTVKRAEFGFERKRVIDIQ